jgi:UTP:GlnB (protein PII) uridylyltransferase
MTVDVEAFLRERSSLIASAPASGASARALSDLTDRAVSALAETALSRLRSPWALVAMGGWGASRLLPHSDLDLLVVTETNAELKAAISDVLYPLWDAGLDVGHQVRPRRDHLRAARGDIKTLTATLTGRRLCGDADLAALVLDDCATWAGKHSAATLRSISTRERAGSPYLLEPDLKEGAGGQRDLDELTWIGAALTRRPQETTRGLLDAGVIDSQEYALLDAAAEHVTSARWAVHRQVPRPTSLMTLELAADSGLALEALQAALADVHHLLLRVRARLGLGTAFYDPRTTPASPLHPDDVFALLDQGTGAVPQLEEAAWSGLLEDLVPEFGALMTVRRPALSHRFTVGAHCVRCATYAVGAADDHPEAAYELAHLADRKPLQVAALVHDIGKAGPAGDHAAAGARALETIGPRFGLTPGQVADARLLVREHLLLAATGSTRDTHDEDVVLQTAARIDRRDLVGALHLLTIADSLATGPEAWTPWHEALVGELVDRLRAALSDEVEGAGIAERAERVRAAALDLAGASDDAADVARFAGRAPLRYLAATTAGDVVTHARLAGAIASSGDPLAFEVAVSTGPTEGSWRASVIMIDRPGLFAAVCGAFALSGLDIMAADAYDAPDGVAIDAFVVRSDTLAAVEPATWSAFERSLRGALIDPIGLSTRIEERRRHYRSRAHVTTTVQTGVAESYATAVTVVAADRVGLLHDLARAISDSGLEIRWARAVTQNGIARDVFHVTDLSGEPVDDPGVLGHLAMRIRERT